ncbi:MAG: hypothetical protein JST49_09340 [Bacteroidetes bacterium]|nr:hypothetical protein [Bacteroidota bacterium]
MPVLVHLADEKESASIKRGGIKIGKYRKGIYCMPVLPDFYVSHQWLRELKRRGAKTYVGVYFKADSKMMVYAGYYNKEHRHITLGEAIKEIMSSDNPLGYELIIDRKIESKEIFKIKSLPQKIGWRYEPESHRKVPSCGCQFCVSIGGIKRAKLREKLEPKIPQPPYAEVVEKLTLESDEYEAANLLCYVRMKKRRSDPDKLRFLLDRNSDIINQDLAITLSKFSHANTKQFLLDLIEMPDADTRGYAASSLLDLYGQEVMSLLISKNDIVINEALEEYTLSNKPG